MIHHDENGCYGGPGELPGVFQRIQSEGRPYPETAALFTYRVRELRQGKTPQEIHLGLPSVWGGAHCSQWNGEFSQQ